MLATASCRLVFSTAARFCGGRSLQRPERGTGAFVGNHQLLGLDGVYCGRSFTSARRTGVPPLLADENYSRRCLIHYPGPRRARRFGATAGAKTAQYRRRQGRPGAPGLQAQGRGYRHAGPILPPLGASPRNSTRRHLSGVAAKFFGNGLMHWTRTTADDGHRVGEFPRNRTGVAGHLLVDGARSPLPVSANAPRNYFTLRPALPHDRGRSIQRSLAALCQHVEPQVEHLPAAPGTTRVYHFVAPGERLEDRAARALDL